MKADTVLTAIVALCCVLAIGATSTTLDSTVSTDPGEVTEVDYDKVPLGTGQAKNLDRAIDGGKSGSGESGASSGDSNSGSGSESAGSKAAENGGQTGAASNPGDGEQKERSGSGESQNQQSAGSGDENSQGGGGSNSQSGDGQTIEEPSLLERLLSLLRDLFDLLLRLLPVVVLVAVVAAVVRYRDRLLSRVAPASPNDETGDETDLEPDPQNEVASAWFEMVERLELGNRRNLTPRECAAAARRHGVDPDAAQTLTSLFEEVRYGGARVTEERRRRAEQTLDRVRSQLEVGQ